MVLEIRPSVYGAVFSQPVMPYFIQRKGFLIVPDSWGDLFCL